MSFENSLACLLSALVLQLEDSPYLRGRVWILILWLRRCRFHVEQPLIGLHLFWLRLKLVEVQLAQPDRGQLLRAYHARDASRLRKPVYILCRVGCLLRRLVGARALCWR